MKLQEYYKQLRTVLLIEAFLVFCGVCIAYNFWSSFCDNSFITCFTQQNFSFSEFIILSLLRPFALTPLPVVSMMAGKAFGPIAGSFFTAIGAACCAGTIFMLGKVIGNKFVRPWLFSNLPQTLNFIRSQDWKIVLFCRLIPIFPFDICSLLFGLLGFRGKYLVWLSFIAILPETYFFAEFAHTDYDLWQSSLTSLFLVSIFCLLPGLAIEIYSRKKGSGLWVRFKAMWLEFKEEIKSNNNIIKREKHDPDKVPVLLLYGYFSSRRVLTILERSLAAKGFEVISFNLGGFLGVFFTRGIRETADFIEYKLQRQFSKHNFDRVHIVAHSKGGLVALWWLLHLKGHRYCKKLITMGTPYKGTLLTWLALVTPIGLVFRDIWQMRPGSSFLKELHNTPIPDDVKIYNLYSKKDKVARGKNGVFVSKDSSSQIKPVSMDHISHFEFLYKREVGDVLAEILGSPYKDSTLRANKEIQD